MYVVKLNGHPVQSVHSLEMTELLTCEDAPRGPHVDRGSVQLGAEEHVGRAVPQRHHLVRVRLRRHRLGAGQTEVGELKAD